MFEQTKRTKPKFLIDSTIRLLTSLGGRVIVELGAMRQTLTHDVDDTYHPCCNDGHSSVLWARTGLDFFTVDIDPVCYTITRDTLSRLGYNNAHVYNKDGIEFLKEFNKTIDLLFLDAWDVGTRNCAEMHLEAYRTAKKNLKESSLILIDDTDVCYVDNELSFDFSGVGGKGKLLIPEAFNDGYKIMFQGRQTLLSRL